MTESTILQIFLLLNVFVMGALVTIAFRHAYAHYRPEKHAEKPRLPAQGVHLPPALRAQLLEASQAKFQTILDRSGAELQHDLQTTAAQLNKHLEKLGTDIVSDEMERYRKNLDTLRSQAETTILGAQADIETHQLDLKAKLAEHQATLETKLVEDMAAQQQQLIAQIDTKLADAVASFLVETLGHNVDLGAQTSYLTALLDQHKEDFKREIADEAPTTR